MTPVVSRRGLLAAGVGGLLAVATGGVGAVEEGWLPGRIRLHEELGLCDVSSHWMEGVTPAPTTTGDVAAPTGDPRRPGTVVVAPPGRGANDLEGLPVVLVLHGLGDTAASGVAELDLARGLAHHVATGGAPFALAGVDGGSSYWHPRAGDDPLATIEVLLDRLSVSGADLTRIGAYGWSMGGCGALLLAREGVRTTTRLKAAVAASPAVFPSYSAIAPGSYDTEQSWAQYGDLVARPPTGVPTMIDCGDTDAFTAVTRTLQATISPRPLGTISTGCHRPDYWRSLVPAQFAFLGAMLRA